MIAAVLLAMISASAFVVGLPVYLTASLWSRRHERRTLHRSRTRRS